MGISPKRECRKVHFSSMGFRFDFFCFYPWSLYRVSRIHVPFLSPDILRTNCHESSCRNPPIYDLDNTNTTSKEQTSWFRFRVDFYLIFFLAMYGVSGLTTIFCFFGKITTSISSSIVNLFTRPEIRLHLLFFPSACSIVTAYEQKRTLDILSVPSGRIVGKVTFSTLKVWNI